MDLYLSPEEEAVSDAVRDYLTNALPVSRLHETSVTYWNETIRKAIGDLGWYGLSVPAEFGGSGFSTLENALLFREFGRHLGPIEVLPILLAVQFAMRHQENRLLAELIAGEHTVAIAFADYGDERIGSSVPLRLFGCTDARYALWLGADQSRLYDIIDASIEARPCLDKSTTMGILRKVPEPKLVYDEPGLFRQGRLAVAAMQVGCAEAVLQMIVEYAQIRETFGRPIGAYQAVRHRCADMALRCELARQQLFAAAVSIRDGLRDQDLQNACAKLLANEAALQNVDANIQLHGGIGITMDHNAHLYLKRAHLMSLWFGAERELTLEILELPSATLRFDEHATSPQRSH